METNSEEVPQEIPEITGMDLLTLNVSAIECLVTPFLPKTGLVCLAGPSDSGKSSILRQLGIEIAMDKASFLNFPIHSTHKSVIIVSTEDGKQETAYLLNRQAKTTNPQDLQRLRFIFSTENMLNDLDSKLNSIAADLVIIDCFADVFHGDLKDTSKIRSYLQKYQELAQKHQCLVMFLHHTGKRTENLPPSKNHLLSGQGFEAKMRLVIELRVDNNNPNYRHLCIVKGNYLPANYKQESFVLEFNEETFSFCDTGKRVPFELISKDTGVDKDREKFDIANMLKKQGRKYDEIASEMGYKNKSSVGKLLAKGNKKGWDTEPEMPDSENTPDEPMVDTPEK
jgi:hypothetical protein